VFVGREEFEAHFLRAFTDVYTGSSAEQRVERLRLIGSDVAIVVTLVSLRASRGRTSGMIQTRLLQVVRRAGRDWQIEAYHNVEVRPQD
jgi:uncharacterized protein (TIGR02246 family)